MQLKAQQNRAGIENRKYKKCTPALGCDLSIALRDLCAEFIVLHARKTANGMRAWLHQQLISFDE